MKRQAEDRQAEQAIIDNQVRAQKAQKEADRMNLATQNIIVNAINKTVAKPAKSSDSLAKMIIDITGDPIQARPVIIELSKTFGIYSKYKDDIASAAKELADLVTAEDIKRAWYKVRQASAVKSSKRAVSKSIKKTSMPSVPRMHV